MEKQEIQITKVYDQNQNPNDSIHSELHINVMAVVMLKLDQ